ncbi:MAG: oxidoreductase, partial [Pseudomonadota bacterium]
PLDMDAFWGERSLSDSAAYAQSKLALTAWTHFLGNSLAEKGPMLVSVNPASFLATKMVKEAYGSSGNDIAVGIDILRRAALSEEFAGAHGRYFDNDSGRFADPHPAALDTQLGTELIQAMDKLISEAI